MSALESVGPDAQVTETSQRRRRFERGKAVLDDVHGQRGVAVIDALFEASPELAHQIVAWGYGEIYPRPALTARDRQLVTLGILTALGGCESQLEVHVNAAVRAGLTPQQVFEVFVHAAVYCGIPRALNATLTAKNVFTDPHGADHV